MPRAKKTTRDNYLRRKFGHTEAAYNERLKKQGGGCKFCGKPVVNVSLHVDHDHKIETMKIISMKNGAGTWTAWPVLQTGVFNFYCEHRLKATARAMVKQHLKRLSVRDILCWGCNAGLKKFMDNPVALANAGKFLKEYYDHLEKGQPLKGYWESE